MIIERIDAIRLVPPRVTLRNVPIVRIPEDVERMRTVGYGERQISEGIAGTVFETYSDIEIGFCSPRDLIVFSQQRQLRPR